MMSLRTLFVVACLIVVAYAAGGADFDYEDQGLAWESAAGDDFSTCGQGIRQSPIDIGTSHLSHALCGTAAWSPKATPVSGHAFHTGTVQEWKPDTAVHALTETTPLISGSYKLAQFHTHFGSEHTVDGHRFALELHWVHANDDGAVAALGVLFEVGAHNAALDAFFDATANLSTGPEVSVTLDPYAVIASLPSQQFYSYVGSLTTPPCSEIVTWHVFTQVSHLSQAQLDGLRAINAGTHNQHTYRRAQPLNGRSVFIVDQCKAASTTTVNFLFN